MHAGALAVALSERAGDALPESPIFNRPLADPAVTDILDDCTHRLGYLKQSPAHRGCVGLRWVCACGGRNPTKDPEYC